MTLNILKSGSTLSDGNSITSIKGIAKTIEFINSNSGITVSMEVENANRFVNIFSKVTNAKADSVKSELVDYGNLTIFKFNFKTL